MPSDDRGSLSYNPSGWEGNNNIYDFVSGGYVYNRCHLIGWQLTAENNNKYNLITGTKLLNVGPSGDLEGMLDFENMVADYVRETENHVMYRVEPIYEGNNLLASGVHLEAWSVEDNGEGISFNVYVMNVQDGVIIDYATGANRKDPSYVTGGEDNDITRENCTYIINSNTKKIHLPSCTSAPTTNAIYTDKTLDELLASGYTSNDFCKTCKPQNAKSLVRSYYYFDKRYFAA
jgi:DNA-entry nuclease